MNSRPLILSFILCSLITALAWGANIGNQIYGVVSETFEGVKYKTVNQGGSGDPDGGYMGKWGGCSLLPDTSDKKECSSSVKCTIFANANSGGMYMQFGYVSEASAPQVATDMSAYAGGSICFWLKAPYDGTIKIESIGGSAEKRFSTDLGITDDQWHYVTIPLSSFAGVNFSAVTVLAGFHGIWKDPVVAYDRPIWVDGVIWKKAASTDSFGVTLRNRTDNAVASQVTWSGAQPGTTNWKAADQYIELSLNCYYKGWSIMLYTDNTVATANPRYLGSDNPAGLVGYDSVSHNTAYQKRALPMCWRIVDTSTTTLTINRGTAGYPDRLWSAELGDTFPCFVWMTDKSKISAGDTSQIDYATVWDEKRGMQFAENTWGGGLSPNRIYLGADFTNAGTPMVFKTGMLIVEMLNE